MTGLSTITVHREELLAKLRANRKSHQREFKKAMAGYREQAIKTLKRHLKEAEDGQEIKAHLSLPKPDDHTEDYDRVIEMVEMSVADTIELTAQEFSQYVRDDWGWKANFTQTASYYK